MESKKTATAFKMWCVKNGYTAKMISESTGLSVRSVLSYMQGTRNPNRRSAKRLEETYKVNTRDLFPL